MSLIGKNLGQLFKNRWNNLMQNTAVSKDLSLSMASLVLVISRVLVANASALKARGTSEGPYRYRESIRTDMREILGWTFSFGLLRRVQKFCERKVDAAMNVKVTADPNVRSLGQDIAALRKGAVPESMPQLGYSPKNLEHIRMPKPEEGVWGKFLNKMLSSAWNREQVRNHFKNDQKAFLRTANQHLPMALGSVPTLIVAGYLLEGWARDYCNQTVDAVSKALRGASGLKHSGVPDAPSSNPPHFGQKQALTPPVVRFPERSPRRSPYDYSAKTPTPALFSGFYR